MRRGLSAKKREEPFVFPRLSLTRPRARRRPLPGTGTLPDAGGAGGGGHAPRHPPARIRRSRPELPRAGKRGARGRESGTSWRVSPRTARTSNTPGSQARPREFAPARHRRRGAEMRRGLSAKKREEPFVFPRLSLTRPRARRRPLPGTGTLPDAGGAGGGGYAPCLPRVRHRPSTSSPPAFHGLAPLPPTGPRPPYPRCQKPEYMVLRYCMGDIPVWRRKIR